jgi:hypothetical protein
MKRSSISRSATRSALLAVLLTGLACARNKTDDDDFGAARDTSAAAVTDSAARNQTETGMTDSTGRSTVGAEAEKTRPDQGQPVTAKGDTLNPGVDSSATPRVDSSTTAR